MSELPSILSIQNLCFRYSGECILKNINLSIQPGDLIATIGPNGAGKTTLLQLIANQLKFESGSISNHSQKTAYMPQMNQIDRQFPISVFQVVAMGLWRENRLFKRKTPEQIERIHQAIRLVGLGDFVDARIGALSGGQFQRVMFARVILENADLILLDEPFSAIDHATTLDLIDLLLSWHQQGKTVVCVTHDLNLVRQFFPQTMILNQNVIDVGATKNVLKKDIVEMLMFQSPRKECGAFDLNQMEGVR